MLKRLAQRRNARAGFLLAERIQSGQVFVELALTGHELECNAPPATLE
jgi:hypothetical protein